MGRRFIRRTGKRFRRKRFIGKRKRFGKIYRRFVRRKAMKPELKFGVIAQSAILTGGSSPARVTTFVSPDQISTGTGNNQKIGRQVNLVKMFIRLQIRNNSDTTGTAPAIHTGVSRIVLWTPRVDSTAAITYMNTLGSVLDQIDFDTVTVVKDTLVTLSPPYMQELAGADISAGPKNYQRVFGWMIKFPRKAKFYEANNANLNPDKDILYMTIVGGVLKTSTDFTTKLFYFDA